jgi:glycosyltransferase involved in cell wall biosynthesis
MVHLSNTAYGLARIYANSRLLFDPYSAIAQKLKMRKPSILALISIIIVAIFYWHWSKEDAFVVTIQVPSLLKFSMNQMFSTQFIQFTNAIFIAKQMNLTLVLPMYLKTRYLGEDPQLFHDVDLTKLYDEVKLKRRLFDDFGVSCVSELRVNDFYRVHIYKPFDPFTEWTDLESQVRQLMDVPFVLDMGDLVTRIITADCENHQALSTIMATLVDCFSHPLQLLANKLRSDLRIDSYTAVELHDYRQFPFELSGSIPKNVSLYIISSSSLNLPDLSLFNIIHTNQQLANVSDLDYAEFSRKLDIISAIDLSVAISATRFIGLSSSAFSHLILSLRLEHGKGDNNLVNLYGDSTFLQNANAFGETTPDSSCYKLDISSDIERRRLSEVALKIGDELKMFGLEVNDFNVAIWILMEPPERALKLSYLHFGVNYGDQLGLFSKINRRFNEIESNILISFLHNVMSKLGRSHSPMNSATPLRILMISHELTRTGAPLALFYIARMFRDCGMHVDIYSQGLKNEDFVKDILSAGIGLIEHYEYVHCETYDIIYLNTIVSWYMEILSLKKAVEMQMNKSVLYVHENWPIGPNNVTGMSVNNTPKIMNEARSILYVTNISMNFYRKYLTMRRFGDLDMVIHNALSVDVTKAQLNSSRRLIRPALKTTDVLFITSGSVHPIRHQSTLFQVAEKIMKDVPNVFVMIVGFRADPYGVELKNEIRSSPFCERFYLLDGMEHSESLKFMASGDVYVSISEKESFGLSVLEAMAMGLPAIVAKLDGLPEVVYEESLDVVDRKTNNISARLLERAMRMMLDPEIRSRHSILSQARSAQFSFKMHTIKHFSVLRAIAGS